MVCDNYNLRWIMDTKHNKKNYKAALCDVNNLLMKSLSNAYRIMCGEHAPPMKSHIEPEAIFYDILLFSVLRHSIINIKVVIYMS